jgi:hypothetical protein
MQTKIKKGDVFGRLTVIGKSHTYVTPCGSRKLFWDCVCSCGTYKKVASLGLVDGGTKSCGCLYNETRKTVAFKHGMGKHKLYTAWIGIKDRCYNPNNHSYSYYGGRGILMLDEWLHDPLLFINYCMSLESWNNKNFSIDRINSRGNYEPGNIRFVSKHVQSANIKKDTFLGVSFDKRSNRYRSYITINKKLITIGYFDDIISCIIARNNFITDKNLTEYPIQKIA